MRSAAVLAALALQLGAVSKPPAASEPSSQPYERAVLRNLGKGGQTCVALDATVLRHTASRTSNDLRLYAQPGAARGEMPFALTESAAEPGDPEPAEISGEHVRGNDVEFDLHMPGRTYSEIDLQTELQDFIAVAQVGGSTRKGAHGDALGTLTLFDFSGEGLPRSTQLYLEETSFPWLHVRVRFLDTRGGPLNRPLSTPVFTGALVPPSRQAQVLYTPVAETKSLANEGEWTHAILDVPEHVPLERVSLELDPSFQGDFLREVNVGAYPIRDGSSRGAAGDLAESVAGSIGRLRRVSPGPGIPAIHFDQLHVPVALGANLRSPARIVLSVRNAAGGKVLPPLPIRTVAMEMRRRSLCFEAVPGAGYMLRYGDGGLSAPAYEYARTFQPRTGAALGTLGPEHRSPGFSERAAGARWRARRPELMWVILIAVVALSGVVGIERMRRHGPPR